MYERTISLIGESAFLKIEKSKIAIFGLGGVGGTCFEALVRSGFTNFYLCDFDSVNCSNLNRQILFNRFDIGFSKIKTAIQHAKEINNNLNIEFSDKKIDSESDFSFLNRYDYVIDAIDDVTAKVHLIKHCLKNDIKIISSLGMGNRLNPSCVEILSLNKTFNDPLAKKIRYQLKKENCEISKLKCVFSSEQPLIKSTPVSSMIFVPSTAGLYIANEVMKDIIKN